MSALINPAALDRFRGSPDIMRHLVQIYLDITPKLIEDIEAGVSSGDSEQVAFHAHSLKGSSSELGAEKLAELCQELQVTAKAGNGPQILPVTNDLLACYKETITALEALEFD